MNIKIFDRINLPHESLLTTRQKTKPRNAFENNISTDIKLSNFQIGFRFIVKKNRRSINESSFSNCKKYFSSIGNNSYCFKQLMQEFKGRCKVLEQQL